jgi:hypothetical protein
MRILTQKEIVAVLNLPEKKRYEHFIKQIADSECIWGLYDLDWVIIKDKDGNKLFPVWPHKEYVELFLKDELLKASPKSIDIFDFIKDFLIKHGKKETSLLVFPSQNSTGFIANTDTLYKDLEEELSKYYSDEEFYEVLTGQWIPNDSI